MLNYIISLLPKAKDKDTDKTKPHPWPFPYRFVFAYYYDVGPTCINKQLIPTHHKYHFFYYYNDFNQPTTQLKTKLIKT